jgi:hypothetical protein
LPPSEYKKKILFKQDLLLNSGNKALEETLQPAAVHPAAEFSESALVTILKKTAH